MNNPKTEYSKREKFIDKFGGTNNECYTPKYAIYPLLPYLKKDWVIWDCAWGKGRLANHFKEEGFNCVGNESLNFFDEDLYCDIIITNPPYSDKDNLEGIKRGKMFRENQIQLIIPNRRINFEIPSGKKSSWFQTSWFCYKMNLPNQLNFMELYETKKNN